MSDFPSPNMSEEAARLISPLELAFVGDSVHTLLIRSGLTGRRPKDMQRLCAALVNARAQAEALGRVAPLLTEAEADIVRRGRNAHAHHAAPKNQDAADYRAATALEALIGYLYLTGQEERLLTLFMHSQEDDNHAQE